MSLRLRLKNTSALAKGKLLKEIESLRKRVRSGGDLYSILDKLYVSAEKILSKIGEPSFSPPLLPCDGDPDPVAWNKGMEEIESDLGALYDELEEVKKARAEATNAGMLASKELQERANYAQSLITDLRLLAGQLDQELIVAGDDFANMDRIDSDFPLTFPMADINTLQGIVTLKKVGAVSIISPNARIQVTPLSPAAALNRLPTPDNTARFYEGAFYAPAGEARPEGGQWHLEERVRPGVVVPGASEIFNLNTDASQPDPFKDFPDLDTQKANRPQGFPLNPEDIVVIDRGAPLEQLKAVRSKMVDGNPDTFWECEFVLNAPELDALAKQLSGVDAAPGTTAASASNELPQIALITPEELRARAAQSDIDRFDLDVEIVVELESRQTVNFITINPMNFGETAWLEVTDVAIASTEDDAFHTVEGFGSQVFDNILTNEANEELTDGEAKTTLAPNRYTYRGLGVYTFPPVEALKIRVRLRQKTPVPVNYERTSVQLNRTLSSSTSKYKGESCFEASTLVRIPGGYRPIFCMEQGDKIITLDHKSGTLVEQTVTKVLRHPPGRIWNVHLWNGQIIQTMASHRFMTADGWRRADELQRHDRLVKAGPKYSTFASVRVSEEDGRFADMYNLYTTGDHTFLAHDILVHNFVCFPNLRTLWHKLVRDWRF